MSGGLAFTQTPCVTVPDAFWQLYRGTIKVCGRNRCEGGLDKPPPPLMVGGALTVRPLTCDEVDSAPSPIPLGQYQAETRCGFAVPGEECGTGRMGGLGVQACKPNTRVRVPGGSLLMHLIAPLNLNDSSEAPGSINRKLVLAYILTPSNFPLVQFDVLLERFRLAYRRHSRTAGEPETWSFISIPPEALSAGTGAAKTPQVFFKCG